MIRPRQRHTDARWYMPYVLMACLAGSALVAAQTIAAQTDIDFTECKIGSGPVKISAQCTAIEVLLNPEDESSGTLELAIARIPARRQSDRQDAFTMIAGGPGQSALESFQAVSFAFRHVMRDRDVILIDQRGTGQSMKLDCPAAPEALGLELGLEPDFDPSEISRQAASCLESLPADPRWFSTSLAVRDLETVRQQLGISQWNLYGVSYGTRVALHYLRRYPAFVRTLVLDAVVPPTVALGPDIAPLAQRALELIFDRCSNDTGCGEAFGHLSEPTADLLQSLKAQPRSITYEDITSGTLTTRQFTRHDLAVILRMMSYSSQTAAILPSMLYDAINNNNFAPLARQSDLQSRSISNSIANGMHHAILCTEDETFIENSDEASQALSLNTNTHKSFLGDTVVASMQATCKSWPKGVIDDDFKSPLYSDVPALILSGGADPITPPEYGRLLETTLNNAHHIVNQHEGHMQAPFGCTPSILAQFVEQASSAQLDYDCLKRLLPLPFFVDANGPLP